MKKILILIFFLGVVGLPVTAVEEKPISVEQMDDINYSYGYQLGRELQAAELDARIQVIYQAIYDAVNNEEPKMSRADMAVILESLSREAK